MVWLNFYAKPCAFFIVEHISQYYREQQHGWGWGPSFRLVAYLEVFMTSRIYM